jgi:amidase
MNDVGNDSPKGNELRNPGMQTDELRWLDAHDIAALVRSGSVSPREVVEATLARLDRLNPTLNAVIHRFDERVLSQADACKAGDGAAPFAGVPFLLKDIVSASKGDPMHNGMAVLKAANWKEPIDSWLTERFRKVGLLLCGRTNTPELATSISCEPIAYGATKNPWALDRSPGGSSGGSAAAVAAGLVPIAHANDMGGSIRIPASHCGLVGLKPTRARSTLGPALGELWGPLTHEHVVTRTVRDCAAMLDAIAGPGIGDPYNAIAPTRAYVLEVGATLKPLRIGFRTAIPGEGIEAHPDCIRAVQSTMQLLESLGHHVNDDSCVAIDNDVEDFGFFAAVVASEVERIGRRIGRAIQPAELEPPNALIMQIGQTITATSYLRSLDAMYAQARTVVAWWHGANAHDILVTPVCIAPPFKLGVLDPATVDPMTVIRGVGERVAFTNPWNNTGQPAISLPLHRNPAGLPIGVQFIAAPGREDLLLRLSAQLEAASPWDHLHPEI